MSIPKKIFFAHSGGVTSVVNTIAASLITEAKTYPTQIEEVIAGENGILGAIHEELINTYHEPQKNIEKLLYTPGSGFGSCRYKLKDPEKSEKEYRRIIEVFEAHNIGYFVYNGGNDSQDTTYKLSKYSEKIGYPLQCIGIPKTIDNDLAITDCCPGYASTAKYIATSIKEASLDIKSMSHTSTKVFIMETMGRHTGWITAAAGIAAQSCEDGPHILLFPEIPYNQANFINKVKDCVNKYGYCVVVAAEGIKTDKEEFLTDAKSCDAFGHQQLGGVAPILAKVVNENLNMKVHWAVADYLQRSARHICSQTDHNHAVALGKAAISSIIKGKNNIMLTIERENNLNYNWKIGETELHQVANFEKQLPLKFMSADQMNISQDFIEYLTPLIQGEAYPKYNEFGIPDYVTLNNFKVTKKLPNFD